MALVDILTQLQDRSTFGTELVINDGNLRISEGTDPDRISIIGACSASESNAQGTDYLIPNNEPFRLVTLQDLRFFQNDDPDETPSEILTAFEDAYAAGGSSFEFVITTRTVGQLAGDVNASATVIPVSTIYTNRVSPIGQMGAHPTGNSNFSSFAHNGDLFVAGGERGSTPAVGTITHVDSDLVDGDYIYFEHSDGTIHGFWFDVSGGAAVPAGLTALVNAGTAGSTATMVDVSGLAGDENDESRALAAAIQANSALPITAYDSGAGTLDLESDEEGTAGNAWTVEEVVADTDYAVTGMAGGAATNTISTRLMMFDTDTSTWSNALDADGVAMRLNVARRDAGAVRETATQVNITGGMTTILGGADTAVATVSDITFASSTSSVEASIAAGTSISGALTTLGESTWVDAGGVWYIIGGQTGGGTRSDMIATFVPSTGVATDTTVNLPSATRWAGAFWQGAQNRIYIFGGETVDGPVSTTSIYDVGGVALLSTPVAGNLSEPKYGMGYATINGAGWSFGGVTSTGPTTRIERFDPDSVVWQRRDSLATVGGIGTATVVGSRILYVDDVQGYNFNVGIGNLSDAFVGFPETFPFNIQVEWEIMTVTGVTTTRSRGRDVDAFIVTRGAKGSTPVAHSGRADIVEDPEVLYDQLEETYEKMVQRSRGDYILPPARAVADNPYLPEGQNFAYQAATYCYAKTSYDRACMAALGVFPPNQSPSQVPTLTEDGVWVSTNINFSHTNYLNQEIWKIGDGVTDANGDKRPDSYAFFATTDTTIPTGSPPMAAGNIIRDDNNTPVDIGKHLFIVYPYGFSTGANYRRKFPDASFGYLRGSAASYVGGLTTLEPSRGSTNMAVGGFTPHRLMSLVDENRLSRRRIIGVVDLGPGGGLRWNTGYTFAWNVDQFNRSDYLLGSTFRKTVAMTRLLRSTLNKYYGGPINGAHINALQVDVSEAIKGMVESGICGPDTDFEFRVSRADKILGRGALIVVAEFEGELTKVRLSITQQAR